MRTVALLLVGTLIACNGEVAPDSSGEVASEQQGEPANAKSKSNDAPVSAPAEYSEEACFDFGAPATGECTVGETQSCDGFFDQGYGFGMGSYCKQVCVNDNGKAVWSEKSHSACGFFDKPWHIEKDGCSCADYEKWLAKMRTQSSSTPLVLSFDDAPVTFTTSAGGAFDLVADGQCHGSDWPSAATPWLALDRDGNGTIDDGSELFGSAVRLANGARAKNGFEALRELDENHDGVFDAKDEAFARVVVWADRDGDRRSTPSELTSLADAGVKSIHLADERTERCDARGNCEGERSLFTTTAGHRGTVVDVYLKTR